MFDLDGTLLNTLGDIADSVNEMLARFGLPTHPTEAYRFFVGDGVEELVRRAMPAGTPDARVSEGMRLYTENYRRLCLHRTAPYPGIVEALEELAAAGVRMGVLTNKNQAESEALVQRYFGGLLTVVQGRTDDMPAKPEPPMTRALMRRLKAGPASTLMVGDTKVDIACGTNVGIATCGVLWGFRGQAELEAAGADWIVERPQQVVDLVLGR